MKRSIDLLCLLFLFGLASSVQAEEINLDNCLMSKVGRYEKRESENSAIYFESADFGSGIIRSYYGESSEKLYSNFKEVGFVLMESRVIRGINVSQYQVPNVNYNGDVFVLKGNSVVSEVVNKDWGFVERLLKGCER